MVLYQFRITDENAEMLESAVTWFRSVTVVHLAVYETSRLGKLHIHCVLDITCKSTFIQQFHKKFKNRWMGNKSYSCETLKKDIENSYIYLSKGTRFKEPDVIFTLLTSEQITQYWQKYWSDKPIEADKTLGFTNKKKSTESWSEMVTKEILEKYPARDWQYDADDIDTLISIVMVKLGQQSKKLNHRIISDLVLGQLNGLMKGKCISLNKQIKRLSFPDLFGGN